MTEQSQLFNLQSEQPKKTRKPRTPRLQITEPIPAAIYESNGLIFEVHNGGQKLEPHYVKFEHLPTIERLQVQNDWFSLSRHGVTEEEAEDAGIRIARFPRNLWHNPNAGEPGFL
jgi:hypothetical protein